MVILLIILIIQLTVGSFYFLPNKIKQAKAAGTTYYVDNTITDTNVASATPDCTNYNLTTYTCSGGSASAFATIADINAFSALAPGDSVLFRKGQTWREQLTVPSSGSAGNPITFGAYGEGVNPIISGANPVSTWTEYVANVTGSVTQANMRLSVAAGTAFVDFSSSGTLTSYLGKQIIITDSGGKTLTGYIKAAGTGETYGNELLGNTAYNNTTGIGSSNTTIASVAGGQSGNALQVTLNSGQTYGNGGQGLTAISGALLKNSTYVKKNTATALAIALISGTTWGTLNQKNNLTPSDWTQYSYYATADGTSIYHQCIVSGVATNAGLFDTSSVTQVLTPSTTGVTITSTANGSTYSWTTEDSGFNRNESSYNYTIVDTVPNIWKATLTSPPATFYVSFDSDKGKIKTSIADLTAAKDWFWASDVLYIYSESDPDTLYTTPGIQANIRNNLIIIDSKDYVTIENLTVTGSIFGAITPIGTSAGIIINSITSYLNGMGIAGSGSSVFTANNCVSYNSFNDNFQVAGTSTGTFNNCEAYNSSNDGFSSNTSGNINCNYCISHDAGVEGIGIQGPGDGYTAHGTGYFKVHYSIGYNNKKSCFTASNTTYGEFYNNTCYSNWDGKDTNGNPGGSGWSDGDMGVGIDTTGAVTYALKNNIFSGHQDEILVTAGAIAAGLTLVSDYNVIYDWRKADYAEKAFTWNDTKYNWADWKAQSGGDAHSINADPLFVTASTVTPDFHLQSVSPAINAGTNVGLTRDYEGNTVPHCSNTNPDIGAYEYQYTCPTSSGGGFPRGYYDPPLPGPNGFRCIINNDDASTNSREVTLTLEAGENVRYAAVSEKKEDFYNIGYEVFKPEVSYKKFILSLGDGLKRVYAQFLTEYSRFSDIVYDEIVLDTSENTEEEPSSAKATEGKQAEVPKGTESIAIVDGDLIRAINGFDVYIVKIVPSTSSGQVEKKFKRLILNPDIFNQYKHLKWENVKQVSQEILDQYTTSDLVRALGDTKVYKLYPDGDIGEKRWIKTLEDFLSFGYDWDSVYTINNYERDSYTNGVDLARE